VAIAATGDDKANLVHTLLAKTEFGVPRTVGRVNHPGNEWLFDEVWGCDVAVSTPRLMCALVEEAVTVGDLVRLFTFQRGSTDLVEMTLPDSSPMIGRRVGDIHWPGHGVLVAIIRDGRGMPPDRDGALETGDELLFIIDRDNEADLARFLSPRAEVKAGKEIDHGPRRYEAPPTAVREPAAARVVERRDEADLPLEE
jgi:trk system potassium uptake protein TrkA